MAGIGREDKRVPGDWPQPELLHDPANTFAIDGDAAAVQLDSHATIAITWEFLVNTLDLVSQLLVLIATTLPMVGVGFVVKRAGGKASYLAGFRNRSKFFAVITDVSALLCC